MCILCGRGIGTTLWNWFSFDLYVVSGLTDLLFTYCVIFPAHNGFSDFFVFLGKGVRAGLWWCVALIPALRQSQIDLCDLETSLIYRVSSRTANTVI